MVSFYGAISRCIGAHLDPTVDVLEITKPDRASRSAPSHLLLCRIRGERVIALKRCSDSPEFIRRELSVAEARKVLGFSHYEVIRIPGVQLRSTPTMQNCQLLAGWDQKETLLVDFGSYKHSKNFSELRRDEIRNITGFCLDYGKWASFNYALGVRDRNPGNFVFFSNTQALYSVDNEEGPFDSAGNDIGFMDIASSTRQNVDTFIAGPDKLAHVLSLKSGFAQGWDMVSAGLSRLTMFNLRELAMTQSRLNASRDQIAAVFFS